MQKPNEPPLPTDADLETEWRAYWQSHDWAHPDPIPSFAEFRAAQHPSVVRLWVIHLEGEYYANWYRDRREANKARAATPRRKVMKQPRTPTVPISRQSVRVPQAERWTSNGTRLRLVASEPA